MDQEQRERKLRQEIHGLRVRKFHWPIEAFKFIMNGLGYGESLRALSEDKLLEFKAILLKYRSHGRPLEYNYDKQGKYMHALMKQAGWSESRLRAFMLKNYSKSHWNLLTKKERRAVIAMFQSYIKKQEITQPPNKQDNPKEDANE